MNIRAKGMAIAAVIMPIGNVAAAAELAVLDSIEFELALNTGVGMEVKGMLEGCVLTIVGSRLGEDGSAVDGRGVGGTVGRWLIKKEVG